MDTLHTKIIDYFVTQTQANAALQKLQAEAERHQQVIADANGALRALDDLLKETTGLNIQETVNQGGEFSDTIQRAVKEAGVEAAAPPAAEGTSQVSGNKVLAPSTDEDEGSEVATVGTRDGAQHKIVVDNNPPPVTKEE